MPKNKDTSVIAEAHKLVEGDRNKDYGDPKEDFTRAANILNAIKNKDDTNEYTAANVVTTLLAVKLARRQHKYKRDTYVDMVGYTEILHRLVADE